ncbi:MAG: hypothetical protein ILP09_06575, partial [Oscillospiraceae bacterium]|nr:hypothetical protein [Oscillospiraceae bacterium]
GLFNDVFQELIGRQRLRVQHQIFNDSGDFSTAFLARAARPVSPALIAAMPQRLAYPVSVKTDEILMLLRDEGEKNLRDILRLSRDRSELAASLMAILELYRNEQINIEDADGAMIITLAAEG